MSGPETDRDGAMDWLSWATTMNRQFAETMDATVDGQLAVAESWVTAVESAADEETIDEGVDSVVRAYDIWMRAARDSVEHVSDLVEGEDVPVERFRDLWLTAANRSFKEVMETAAFSMATGQSIEDLMDLRRQADVLTETGLHELGLPSHGDIEEVGARLVELERRTHTIESKLDELVEAQ